MAKPAPMYIEEEPYYHSAAPLVPDGDLDEVREAATRCQACHLWRNATQTVFGEGSHKADFMLVGEQPGDKEDEQGHPFVGPAGRVLNEALAEAGIEPAKVYTTNAVKHFKWEPRGHRRLHKKPNRAEMAACRPWLEAELRLVQPKLVVALGATAAQSFFGASFRVTQHRGEVLSAELHPSVLATVHPSSILRQQESEDRRRAMQELIEDLRAAKAYLA